MRYFIIVLLVLLPSFVFSQYTLDYGFNLGASNYLGEMGGRDDSKIAFAKINFRKTGITTGVWVRKKLHPLLSVKANLLFLRIAGTDSLLDNPSQQDNILHFRNSIFELSGQAELHFIRITDLVKRGRFRSDFDAYLYGGAGMFYHNPKAFYGIEYVALQPLGTEGQGRISGIKPYRRFQAAIPFGFGFSFTVERTWRLGLEFGWRETFTDYLDDVSTIYADPAIFSKDPLKLTPEEVQMAKDLSIRSNDYTVVPEPGSPRGNSKYNDAYIFAVLNFGYVVRGSGDFEANQYKFRTRAKKRKTRAKF